jgi:hypothetical protein
MPPRRNELNLRACTVRGNVYARQNCLVHRVGVGMPDLVNSSSSRFSRITLQTKAMLSIVKFCTQCRRGRSNVLECRRVDVKPDVVSGPKQGRCDGQDAAATAKI